MKFWMIFAGLLLTPALQAQVPFYDCPCSQYYSGTYPGAYFPSLYPFSPYTISPYTIDRFSTSTTNETIDSLTRQVERLTENVQLLETQIVATETQRVLARVAEDSPTSYERPARPVTLVLKNGRRIEARGYAIAGQTVWVMTADGIVRVPILEFNLTATQRANIGRDVLLRNGS